MKLWPLFLAGSLALNAALAVVFIARSPAAADRSPAGESRMSRASAGSGAHARSEPRAWGDLARCDDRGLFGRLKALGFPVRVARALTSARLTERYMQRRRALEGGREAPYWRVNPYDTPLPLEDAKVRARLRALDREMEQAMESAFGPFEDQLPDEMSARYLRQYGDLPRSKIRQIEAVNRDYGELRSEVRDSMQGITLPEDRERLELIEKEQRADLEQILSPEELEAYDLRSSSTARELRNQLANFNPTEEEYRALFRAQQDFLRQYGSTPLTSTETSRLREVQIQAALGPERFAEYVVTTSGSYREMRDLMTELKLPTATIGQVIMLQRDYAGRADSVRSDSALTTDQRNAQLASLAEEAKAKLGEVFGKNGFTRYQQTGSSVWLFNQLAPRYPTATTP